MSSTERDEIYFIGRSVRGPGHVEDDIPNQDSWASERVSDELVVITVGDGVGSASLSHEGSAVATQKACAVLTDRLQDAETIDQEFTEEIFQDSLEQAKAAVEEKADELDEPPTELQTTLLSVIVGPFGIAGAAVGDGGIVYKEGNSYELLIDREMAIADLAASNYTHPLVDDEWPTYRTGFTDTGDGMVIFTDGVEEFIWDDLDSVRPGFFNGVFEIVQKIDDQDQASQKLEELLESDDFRKLSDDKTVAIATLPPSFRKKGIETASGDTVSIQGPLVEDQLREDSNSRTYRISEPEPGAAKLYYSESIHPEKLRDKIQAMIANPPQHSSSSDVELSFAWPTKILEGSGSGEFLGYQVDLPAIEAYDHVLEYAKTPTSAEPEPSTGFLGPMLEKVGVMSNSGSEDNRHDIALALAEGVAALHQAGHAIGDFHHSKVFVDDSSVVLADCDDYHIQGDDATYVSGDLSSQYAPSVDEITIEKAQQSDRFGLAVHIFQILMNGYHPFQQDGSNEVGVISDPGIDTNPFPYRASESDQVSPPDDAPSYSELPSDIQNLFEACFTEGKDAPEARPSAEKWVDALSD